MKPLLTIAIAGDFQRGKSSFVNALLGRNASEMGRGRSTTHSNSVYELSPSVSIIDTPGFNANNEDNGTAASAIDKANVVVYIHESKQLGETGAGIFNLVREQGKRLIFLLNCMNSEKWAPDENKDIVKVIEAELENKGVKSSLLPINGCKVTPVNILWARYGLGLLDEASKEDSVNIRKICRYAKDDLEISASGEQLCDEILNRSGCCPVFDFLKNFTLWYFKNEVSDSKLIMDRILNRFKAEFEKNWKL